ncbi:C-type lectin domain family 4 member E isoform X3 [Nothobranchius furzeri]|uniref:C-type lectin domain family 4 member E isoform X3 n=1 Tax=Nothobranchius furzeri TaxID=105023 RepID=UPI0039046A27
MLMRFSSKCSSGEAAAFQHEKPNRKSNLLLWALLAAALIIVYRLAFDKIRTNKTLQTLKEENEALRKHISGSRSFCEDLGADLVKIDSREEQEFLVEKVKNFVMDTILGSFWIGLTDSEVEGNWTWVDGSPLDSRMKFWLEGEPNNAAGRSVSGEDCVAIVKRGVEDLNTWNDDTCSFAHKSICEKPAGTGPSSSACG